MSEMNTPMLTAYPAAGHHSCDETITKPQLRYEHSGLGVHDPPEEIDPMSHFSSPPCHSSSSSHPRQPRIPVLLLHPVLNRVPDISITQLPVPLPYIIFVADHRYRSGWFLLPFIGRERVTKALPFQRRALIAAIPTSSPHIEVGIITYPYTKDHLFRSCNPFWLLSRYVFKPIP
jgi:hypothetical protein